MTLKNAAWFFGTVAVLFIAFSLYNEFLPRDTSRERLSERGSRDSAQAPRPKPSAVVPIEDETFATRRSVERALPLSPPPARPSPVSTPAPPPRRTLKETHQRGERIVITQGTDGMRVDVRPAAPTSTAPPDSF